MFLWVTLKDVKVVVTYKLITNTEHNILKLCLISVNFAVIVTRLVGHDTSGRHYSPLNFFALASLSPFVTVV